MRKIVLGAALIAGLVLPLGASAQGGPGFLFNRPRVSVGIRTGYMLPRASSPLFEDARSWYNLNRFDFDSPYLGGEIAARVSERWDIALGAGWGRSTSRSHYREYVDQDGLEIEQRTRFQTVSATLGGRYYFSDRGRRIGRFAWVPAAVTPFVGAGAGVTWYQLEQSGDFIDFGSPTLDIVGDRLETDGAGATAYAGLGADISLGKQLYLTAEGRYAFAKGAVRGEYAAYDGIDLSGLQLLAGISVRW
ncbi:MAG: hypothetical protein AB7T31_15225 [Gemmatimonadales bacterium]